MNLKCTLLLNGEYVSPGCLMPTGPRKIYCKFFFSHASCERGFSLWGYPDINFILFGEPWEIYLKDQNYFKAHYWINWYGDFISRLAPLRCIKQPDQKASSGMRIALPQSWRGHSLWQRGRLGGLAWFSPQRGRKQQKVVPAHRWLSLSLPFTLLWLVPHGHGATHIWGQSFLLCSLHMLSKTSQEVCLNNFQVVLNPFKMTVETNHYNNSHAPWKTQCPYLLDRKIRSLGAANKE